MIDFLIIVNRSALEKQIFLQIFPFLFLFLPNNSILFITKRTKPLPVPSRQKNFPKPNRKHAAKIVKKEP